MHLVGNTVEIESESVAKGLQSAIEAVLCDAEPIQHFRDLVDNNNDPLAKSIAKSYGLTSRPDRSHTRTIDSRDTCSHPTRHLASCMRFGGSSSHNSVTSTAHGGLGTQDEGNDDLEDR